MGAQGAVVSVGVVEVRWVVRCRSLAFGKLVLAKVSSEVQGSLERRTQSGGHEPLELRTSLEGDRKRAAPVSS